MLSEMAVALGKRRRPMIPVPLLSPYLSSLWIGLVTTVDAGLARPLIEGLSTETVVTDPSGARLFDVDPLPFRECLEPRAGAGELTLADGPTAISPAVGSPCGLAYVRFAERTEERARFP